MPNDSTIVAGKPAVRSDEKIILLVDDEIDMILTFSMLLELHGFRLMTAVNGQQALELVATQTPHLVISDCMMPVLDGVELTQRLRGDVRTAAIPIILMSAAPQLNRLSDARHDVFVQKPVRFQELLAVVERLLHNR
jgi:CheY-like chemotaxis protein